MKNNYDLMIFDWDGTLIDSIAWIVSCLQHAAGACGLEIPGEQAARDVIGLNIQGAMQRLFPGIDSDAETRLVQCYGNRFLSRQHTPDDLFDGVPDMLQQLKQRGLQLAVATGKTRKGLNKILQDTRSAHFFAATRCADETASKPEPLMLRELMRQLGAAPERTLMIGDSVHDLQMAANAHIAAVAVTCGTHSRDVLQQYRPLHCLDQTKELLTLLER
ncbi:MAG: HAD family hydrolase [Gammaproteobacteria bacterium]